ncbi:Secretory protein OPEL [Phytophthora cinnamomi]|uniref:Secretory protein OPEL n=1 Tax=Phytophthora cinnamomi TaxID=4785 RepID=UPI00355A5136|nr:Secretory protein OPEL [Phytophthora cinnamomi]
MISSLVAILSSKQSVHYVPAGKSKKDALTVFKGVLDPPRLVGNGQCLGFSGDNDYQGWNGGKKEILTEVKMLQGNKPNLGRQAASVLTVPKLLCD